MADDEFDPYVVLRVSGTSMECALGALETGERALNLFLTNESADAYRHAANLPPEWRSVKPPKNDLLAILRHSVAGGIPYAILEPGGAGARIFNLEQVLSATAQHSS